MCRNPYYNKEYRVWCPCRQCEYCHKKRISHWTTRLQDEAMTQNNKAIFITLTYDDKHLPKDYGLDKTHVQGYIKRLRQRIVEKLDRNRKIKYFVSGEYGSQTSRPHYHALIFGITLEEYQNIDCNHNINICRSTNNNLLDNQAHTALYTSSLWGQGHVSFGYDTSQSVIRYVAKYINKKAYGKLKDKFYGDRQAPFHLSSQALGIDEALRTAESLKKNKYIRRSGLKLSIPPYYRKKLDITADDYQEIISKNDEKLVDRLTEICQNSIYIDTFREDESYLKRNYIDIGQHIGGRPITDEAYNELIKLRKVVNDGLKAKRKLAECKSPDKI